MKKYLYTFILSLFSLSSYSQRYGRMSDVYEAMGEDGYYHTSDWWIDSFVLLFMVGLLIAGLYLLYEYFRKELLPKIKKFFFSKRMYIIVYCIWLALQIICLNVGKYRKPYDTWNINKTERIAQTQEECFYPLRHFKEGCGQNEPLYAYDCSEFILYAFAIPLVLWGLYFIIEKLTKSIWLDGIYIFLTFWFLLAFIIAVSFYSDGSECGFWAGWIPSIFLTAHFLDKKEEYQRSLKA